MGLCLTQHDRADIRKKRNKRQTNRNYAEYFFKPTTHNQITYFCIPPEAAYSWADVR